MNISKAHRVLLPYAASCVMLLSACSPTHHVTIETPTYDPTVSARIRILTGNDMQNASFRLGSCATSRLQNDPDRIDVDDGFLARYKYSSRSIVIGMPQSPRPGMRVGGLHFKDMIREYIVPDARPVTLSMRTAGDSGSSKYGGYSWSCTAQDRMFTPVAGQDYDVYLGFEGNSRHSRGCAIEVRHIDGNGLDEPVETRFAPKCPVPEANEGLTKRGP
jgi:hypothetical protein